MKPNTNVGSVSDNPIGERRPIRIADIEWEDFTDPDEPDREPGPFVRWLVDPASGNRVMHVKSWAGRNAAAHWHLSDTVYLVTKGEFIVEGEEPYREGDLRWVRGRVRLRPGAVGARRLRVPVLQPRPLRQARPRRAPAPAGPMGRPVHLGRGLPPS